MAETNKKNDENSLDNAPKKNPLSVIKKKNVIIIAAGLLLILGYSLIRMGAKNQENVSNVEKEKEVNENQPGRTTSFEVVDYSKVKNEEEEPELALTYQTSNLPDIEKNIEATEEVVIKNEKLEAYYDKMLSEEIAARTGVIEFGNNAAEGDYSGRLPDINIKDTGGLDLSALARRGDSSDDFNKQPEKKAFLSENANKNYNSSLLEMPISKYEIKAGGIIPGVMLTGINSDLPGTMTASVRENVYDTVTGKYLLIPRGTRVVGKYSSNVSFGQSRVLVVWQRLIFPNGKSLNLDNFEGADMTGYSGLVGKVDNHTLKLFQGVVLSSILGAAAGIIDDGGESNSWKNNAGRGAGEEIVSIGEAIASRLLAVQPTITIKPGARFNIMVNSDIILEPYHRGK